MQGIKLLEAPSCGKKYSQFQCGPFGLFSLNDEECTEGKSARNIFTIFVVVLWIMRLLMLFIKSKDLLDLRIKQTFTQWLASLFLVRYSNPD